MRLSKSIALFIILSLSTPVALATTWTVSDQATCEALPGSATWTATIKDCLLNGSFYIGAGDELVVTGGASISIESPNTLTVDGGNLDSATDGRLRIRGDMTIENGGTVNAGYWDIRNHVNVTISADSTVFTSQLQLVQGTLTNGGQFNMFTGRVASGSTLVNNGTLNNSSTTLVEGSLENNGIINNTGQIEIDCGDYQNNGTVSGNPVIYPYCWKGGTGNWSTPANWNLDSVPPSTARILVWSGNPHLDTDVTVEGSLEIKFARLTVPTTRVLDVTATGTINIFGGNVSPGSTVLENSGVVSNAGKIYNNDQILNHGILSNHNRLDINSGNGEIKNYGIVNNYVGAFALNGISNEPGGVFNNEGDWQVNKSSNSNSGVFNNMSSGTFLLNNTLVNTSGAVFDNLGVFKVTAALTFPGKVENDSGATIFNRSGAQMIVVDSTASVDNRGDIQNEGGIANNGIINNSGRICGGGTLSGNPVSGNPPLAICNEPPVAVASPDFQVIECTAPLTPVVLDGSGSADPDGDALTYAWTPATGLANPAAATTSGEFGLGNYNFSLEVTDPYGASDSDSASFTIQDTTSPVLQCANDVTVSADEYCMGHANPVSLASDVCDTNPVISRNPSGNDWPLGVSQVQYSARDESNNLAYCSSTVKVVDDTSPAIQCNVNTEAFPGHAVSYQATATDNCSVNQVVITGFDCWSENPAGKRVDKTGSCVVSVSGDTITLDDPGGAGTRIDWTVSAQDGSGNEQQSSCGLVVQKPGAHGQSNK